MAALSRPAPPASLARPAARGAAADPGTDRRHPRAGARAARTSPPSRRPRASQPAPARSSPRHRRMSPPGLRACALPSGRGARRDGTGASCRRIRATRPAAATCASIRSRSPCSTGRTGDGVIDWIKALHTNLLIEGRSGRSIIGWIGVGLLALAMIGVVLWWPPPGQWRAAFTGGSAGDEVTRSTAGCMARSASGASRCCWQPPSTGVVLAFPQTTRGALGLAAADPRRLGPDRSRRRRWTSTGRSPWPEARRRDCASVRCCCRPSGADPVRVLLVPPDADGVAATVTVAVDADGIAGRCRCRTHGPCRPPNWRCAGRTICISARRSARCGARLRSSPASCCRSSPSPAARCGCFAAPPHARAAAGRMSRMDS